MLCGDPYGHIISYSTEVIIIIIGPTALPLGLAVFQFPYPIYSR